MGKALLKDRVEKILFLIDNASKELQGIELANIDSFSLLAKASCFLVEQVCEHLIAIEQSLTEISNEIPWKSIHGVRVRIAHIYDAIEMDVIYKIITEDFISLRNKLVNIINKI